jgi:hypothetical protein
MQTCGRGKRLLWPNENLSCLIYLEVTRQLSDTYLRKRKLERGRERVQKGPRKAYLVYL